MVNGVLHIILYNYHVIYVWFLIHNSNLQMMMIFLLFIKPARVFWKYLTPSLQPSLQSHSYKTHECALPDYCWSPRIQLSTRLSNMSVICIALWKIGKLFFTALQLPKLMDFISFYCQWHLIYLLLSWHKENFKKYITITTTKKYF